MSEHDIICEHEHHLRRYQPDWTGRATHLVCAFVDTPKYVEVKSKGGKIVTKEWVLDQHRQQKQFAATGRYLLDVATAQAVMDADADDSDDYGFGGGGGGGGGAADDMDDFIVDDDLDEHGQDDGDDDDDDEYVPPPASAPAKDEDVFDLDTEDEDEG